MRWTQVRRVFLVVGLITILYGLVVIGRVTAGASVSLWGANPTATVPASVPAPSAAAPAPALVLLAPTPTPPVAAQVPAPAPLVPSAPAPASEDEALEQAYKRRLLEEGDP